MTSTFPPFPIRDVPAKDNTPVPTVSKEVHILIKLYCFCLYHCVDVLFFFYFIFFLYLYHTFFVPFFLSLSGSKDLIQSYFYRTPPCLPHLVNAFLTSLLIPTLFPTFILLSLRFCLHMLSFIILGILMFLKFLTSLSPTFFYR